MGNKPRQIILSDEQWEDLRREAFEKHQSISAVIRTRLFESTIVSPPDELTKYGKALVGFGSSIPAPKPGKR